MPRALFLWSKYLGKKKTVNPPSHRFRPVPQRGITAKWIFYFRFSFSSSQMEKKEKRHVCFSEEEPEVRFFDLSIEERHEKCMAIKRINRDVKRRNAYKEHIRRMELQELSQEIDCTDYTSEDKENTNENTNEEIPFHFFCDYVQEFTFVEVSSIKDFVSP